MNPPDLINGGPSPRGWGSQLGTAMFCMQLYAWKYKAGGRRQSSLPQSEGTILHAGAAHWYARHGADQPGGCTAVGHHYTSSSQLLTPHEAMLAVADIEHRESGWTFDMPRLNDCMQAYMEYWTGDLGFRILHVEDVYTLNVEDPVRKDAEGRPRVYTYTGRADLVYEANGFVRIVDHKGTGRITKSAVTAYSISAQFIGWQHVGAQVYGPRWGGMTLNLIQREPPFKFERPPLKPAPALISRFPQIVIDAQRRIDDLEAEGRPASEYPPMLHENGCIGRYAGGCDAMQACMWGRIG